MRELWKLQHLLSLSRIVLGAAGMACIVMGTPALLVSAALLVVIAELTDHLDGAIARRRGGESELGRSLDLSCDAVFHLSMFLALLSVGWMPLWAAICIYACEISMPYLRSFARQFGAASPPHIYEQMKSLLHGLSQVAILFIVALSGFDSGTQPLVAAIFAFDVVVSFIVLFANLRPLVRAGLDAAGK